MTIAYNENYNGTTTFSDTCAQVACATNTEETFTVPGASTAQYQALFSYTSTSNVFIRLNTIPAIPASGTVGTEQYNEFRPCKRYVRGGDVIHFITPDTTAYCGFSLMQLQGQ